MKLKEENVMQARDQIKRAENIFKEEVERLRNEFFEQVTKDYEHQKVNSEYNKSTIQYQTVLKQIHVALCNSISEPKEGDEKALLKDFEKAIQVASQTIEKLQLDLDKANFQTLRFKQNLKALALNKVVISRQESLQIKLQKFQQSLIQREEERSSLSKAQDISTMKLIREQELQIAHLTQELKSVEEENYQLRDDLRLIRDQKDEIEQSLVLFEQEIESKKQAMEKNAELTVDDRFKAKHEAIKCYFDSQITKILIGQQQQLGGNERILDMGREILAHKLLVQKLESQIVYEQSESQSLELNLAHYKEQLTVNEQRIRELQTKNNQITVKVRSNDVSQRMELQRAKQQAQSLEKELIKVRENLENKSRECINSIEGTISTGKTQKKDESNDMQIAEKDHIIKNQSSIIEELQEKLLDVRTSHIQEIEFLRVQFDSQLAEGKLQLAKDREQLEKRYLPGHAPGDVQQENQDLHKRVQDLRASLDQLIHENAILKKKYENENLLNDTLKREVESYRQAIVELEATMVDMGRGQHQTSHIAVERSNSRGRQVETDKKQSKKSLNKNGGKKMNKDPTVQSLGQQVEETTSLMTSAITSVPEGNQQTIKANCYKSFNINPPALVKALVQSKLNELQILKKFDDLLQVEVTLRHELKEAKLKELHSGLQNQPCSEDNDQLSKKIIELQVEVEDLKIQRAHEQVDQIQLRASQYHQGSNEKGEIHLADYNTLIDAVMGLSIQLAIAQSLFNKKSDEGFGTQGNPQAIEEAQRLVIRDLQIKINNFGNFFENQNQHYDPPSEEQDRKLWYLELLESQVIASENVMTNLQSFIKKLQIDVQGSLQSAASIKSASMDLANNLKRTSEEIKALKHVAALAKHDLAKVSFNAQKTINPFTQQDALHQSIKGNTMNSQSVYNQLMQQQDHIQNQLLITEKVKKSLEDELVSLKVAHQQELQQLNSRLTQALDQRNSMLQNNEDLHERVNALQLNLDALKAESAKHCQDYEQTQALLLEKERDKQLLAQTKTATSKHLAKLQSDMQEWRRQTDDNMRLKDTQISELQAANTALMKEKERLKSENGMLRRVDKDRRGGESEEVRRVIEENREMAARIVEMVEERKKEVEYWVSERATMREMIEQLENDKVNEGGAATVLPDGQDCVKQAKKKYQKKIKEKEVEIKNLQGKLESLKDEAHRARQVETQLDQKLREQIITLQETQDQIKYLSSRLKEVELERDLILAEKNNAICTNDITAQHIQEELNSLRECFAKLKIERDNLLYDIESSTSREKEWRRTVERLSDEVQNLEVQIANRERDQSNQVRSIESKNSQLMQEAKYAKEETQQVREKIRAMEQQSVQVEQKMHQSDLMVQQAVYQQEEYKRQLNEARIMVKKREDEISQLQETVLLQEGQKLRDIESLNDKLAEVKEANSHLAQLYEAQITELKQRLIIDKKKTEQQADQIINVSQREAVIKQLKKENIGLKAAFAKVKSKNKEMKLQLMSGSIEKENLSNQSVANSASTKHSTQRKPGRSANSSRYYNQAEEDNQVDKSVLKLAQLLLTTLPLGTTSSEDKHLALFNQLQRYNKSAARIVELEAEIQKQLHLDAIARDQIQVLKEDNEDLLSQLQETKERVKGENKGNQAFKQISEQLDNTKTQLRQAHQELLQLRQEWLPPSEAKSIQEKLKEAQAQAKGMKEELQRKKDVIQQLKNQKEQTVTEANQVAADLEGLKDDNAKLQRLLKENAKQLTLVHELRSANDQLRATERRLRDEIVSLSDRLRSVKQDSLRKDTLCRELKERLDQMQDDMAFAKDKDGEVDRLKEQVKKLKLETEIKENQVRTLKVKIEHQEGLNEQLKKSVREEQKEEQTEVQLRTAKNKLKKAENAFKKCIEGLKKVSKEVANAQISKTARNNTHQNSLNSGKNSFQPAPANQEQNQMKQYYKDSVNILGMSIDELMDDFVAPKQNSTISEINNPNVKIWEQQLLQTVERLNFSSNINNEDLNDVVDQVCNLCIKLLGTIASQSQTVSALSQSPHIHSSSVKMLV